MKRNPKAGDFRILLCCLCRVYTVYGDPLKEAGQAKRDGFGSGCRDLTDVDRAQVVGETVVLLVF